MNKELKKMSRAELLEILISQMEANEKLTSELEECKKKLEDKNIVIAESGSMAEAAMRLNRVFEAADAAARQFVDSARGRSGTAEKAPEKAVSEKAVEVPVEKITENRRLTEEKVSAKKSLEEADKILADKRKEAQHIVHEAEIQAQHIIEDANMKSEKIISDADAYWKDTIRKAKVMLGK